MSDPSAAPLTGRRAECRRRPGQGRRGRAAPRIAAGRFRGKGTRVGGGGDRLEFDHVVIGAGSAGCAAAARLAEAGGTVAVLEAGPGERDPRVRVPFGLVWLMGSRRDWRRRTAPQAALGGRTVAVPRGRLVGGSGSINSMVWFRGRRDDWDAWGLPGWRWADVEAEFEEVERRVGPARLADPHPLARAFGAAFGANDPGAPATPERQSAGISHCNLVRGARRSAADAFLRPAMAAGGVTLLTRAEVRCLLFEGRRATGAILRDGRRVAARGGVVLSAGAIESPMILMRSGIGPAAHLRAHGIAVRIDAPGVGANLHDHPAVGLHFEGAGSGYGLTARQGPAWAAAPALWLAARRGRLASNTVEACAFLKLGEGDGPPEVQTHFVPFMLGWQGRAIVPGREGYFADVCVCRPRSRGRLTMADPDSPAIDPGLLSDPADLDVLVRGVKRLRAVLGAAPFGTRRAPEAHPGAHVAGEALREHVRAACGTAYHPVGTLALNGPVTPEGRVRGAEALWVADASVMPSITSANTNAPSMLIGWRIGGRAAAAAREGIAA